MRQSSATRTTSFSFHPNLGLHADLNWTIQHNLDPWGVCAAKRGTFTEEQIAFALKQA